MVEGVDPPRRHQLRQGRLDIAGFAELWFDSADAQKQAYSSPKIRECDKDSELFIGAVSRVVTGAAMDAMGTSALFATIAAAFALYSAYAFYRTTRRAKPADEVRSDFRAIPLGKGQTPQTVELDPRVDITDEDFVPERLAS